MKLHGDIRRFSATNRKMIFLIVFAVLLLGQASVQAQCPTGMTHYWKFSETGQPYQDTVGATSATCTICPTAAAGRVAGALTFGGATGASQVDAAIGSTLDWGTAQSFTIEFWMQKSAACSETEVIVGRTDVSINWWVGIDCTSPHVGQIQFHLQSDVTLDVWSSTVVSDGNWHHIAVVRDGTTGVTDVYVDGVSEGSSTQAFTTGFASTSSLNIGWLNSGTFSYYDGVLDELATYDRTLSLAEIEAHHVRGQSGLGYCNSAPVLATIGAQGVNEGANLSFIATAADPDGQTAVLTAENLPPNATYTDHADGTATFDFNPDFTQSGVHNVTFIASDGTLADTEIVAITVTNVDRAPVLATIGAQGVNEGANLNFIAAATDPDGQTAVMMAENLPPNATYTDHADGTATFDFNPDFTQSGVHNVTFIASDGTLADTEIVAITVVNVNRAPVLASIGPRSVNAGSSLTFNTSATDADGPIPVMTAINLPAHATYLDHADGTGTFAFLPDMIQSGIYNVTFIASDGSLADSEIVAITVINSANQAPLLDSIGPKIVYEGAVLTFQVHATDEAGFPMLVVSATTMNNHYTFVDGGNGYGMFTYSPDYYEAGTDTVTFFAVDNGGASDVEKVVITTLDVNRPPHISRMTDYTILPGDSLKIRVVATDSTDPNGGALYLISLAKPAAAVFTDSTGGKGSLRWKATIADTGTHNFIVLCLDDESPALSEADTARITVLKTNQAPVLATIGTKLVSEGEVLSVHLSATDPDGTIPFFYAQGVPTNATLVDSGNGRGSFTFRPTFQQSGLYSVKFYASDGNKVDYEVVLIQVVDVPQPPILSVPADTQWVLEGDSLFFKISVTDPDNTIDTLKFDATTLPVNATFVDSLNGRGLFRFKPNFAQAGVYNVRFFATDGVLKDTAVVVVNCVSAGNQRPKIVVTPTSVTAKEFDYITIRVTATDADGSYPALTTSTPLPFTAAFTDSGLGIGRLNWHTDNLQLGTYQIVFYATDLDTTGVVDSFTVPIVLNDFNVAPSELLYEPFETCNPFDCQRTLNEGATLAFKVFAKDKDLTHPLFRMRKYLISGTDTLYSAAPPNMTLTDLRNDTANFIFTPDYTQSSGSPYNIMFTARDEADTTIRVQTAMKITVTDVSMPVVLDSIGSLSVLEGGVLDVTVTGRDPDGYAVVLSAAGLPPGATFTALTGQPAGTAKSRFLYSPGTGTAGIYTTIFKATESVGSAVDSEVVAITVINPANLKPVLTELDTLRLVNVNGDQAVLWIRAVDPDGTKPALSVTGTPKVPYNAVFRDSGNGHGSFIWDPTETQIDSTYLLNFIASDGFLTDNMLVKLKAVASKRGDADNDGSVDISDVVYLIGYIFGGGLAPITIRNGNADGSDADGPGAIDISDAVYLIAYIFSGGPAPPL